MTRLVRLAALSAGVAVMAGAFGAHGAASPQAAGWLRTGAEYQLAHAVGVLAVARVARPWVGGLLLGGAALFAGTLYLMAVGGPLWLGAVTPVGGLGMIGGWIALGLGALRGPEETRP